VALTGAKVDLVSVNPIESYEFYTVEGTITIPSGGSAKLVVGKKSNGIPNVVTVSNCTGGSVNVLESPNRISSVPAPVAVTATAQNITLVKAEITNTGANIIYKRDSATVPTAAEVNDYPLYAGEVMGLLTGVYSVVCGAALTSTLNIVELV
jgi:hypothetical protein